MNQKTEKRTIRALKKLHKAMLKNSMELGLALNECEAESDDYQLCNDRLYQATVGVWFAVQEAIEKIGKTLNKK